MVDHAGSEHPPFLSRRLVSPLRVESGRFLIHDRDSIFSAEVDQQLQADESHEFDGLLGPSALGLKQIAFDFERHTLSWEQ